MKQVHQESFENIIPVMPKDDGRAAFLARDPVEIAAPQT
jgi:hypothetical protein